VRPLLAVPTGSHRIAPYPGAKAHHLGTQVVNGKLSDLIHIALAANSGPEAPLLAVIVADERVDCVAFTGSVETGKSIAARCAERLGARRGFHRTVDIVEDLEAVREALGVERISLIGVSYGTLVAQSYAARYPARFRPELARASSTCASLLVTLGLTDDEASGGRCWTPVCGIRLWATRSSCRSSVGACP
jgi:hypothetical protein